MVGVDEGFMLETSSAALAKLPLLPTNGSPRTLPDVTARVYDLAANHHMGMYRDIVPVEMLAPTRGDQTYWPHMKKVLTVFKNYNLHLILSFGSPLPQWMAPSSGAPWSGWCIQPAADPDWEELKNDLAWTIGGFAATMANDPDFAAWAQDHLYIEGFNEFDGVGTSQADGTCTPWSGSAGRAADLQNGIAYVLDHYGAKVQTLMPSAVGGNAQWVADYYAAGGSGLPNVHLYFPPGSTVQQALSFFEGKMAGFDQVVPPSMQNRIYLGEIGVAEAVGGCSAADASAMDDADQQALIQGVVTDPVVENATEAVVFWRLYDLPPTASGGNACENQFGITDIAGTTYDGAGTALFGGIDALVQGGL
jgi:hypothetical protein